MASTIKLKNGSGAPLAGDLVQGEPALDLTNKRLYTENASGTVIEVGVNPAAEITANGGIALPDNQKATFGASDDLQIYHDGSNSIIRDVGAGDLRVQGQNLQLLSANGKKYLYGVQDAYTKLYYDNAEKLATTSTGIDVTGTVTADGLTVDGTVDVNLGSDGSNIASLSGASAGRKLDIQSFAVGASAGAGYSINATSGQGQLDFQTAGNSRLNIEAGGDISFYEDTGTTAKFYWDASAERLGIGTSSPATALEVYSGTASSDVVHFAGATGTARGLVIGTTAISGNNDAGVIYNANHTSGTHIFQINGTGEAMRIDSSGNVGIGTDSPSGKLHVESNDASQLLLTRTGAGTYGLGVVSGDALVFQDGSTERARIDASGNLLVGRTTSGSLTVAGSEFQAGGAGFHIRDGGTALYVGRKTSDGALVEFSKDGTTVGSIGTKSDLMYAGTGDTGVIFSDVADSVYPWNTSTNANRDAAVDLGTSSVRFKDLYLSGGVYLGGTGAANKLDDYEEGTFTATLEFGGASTGITYVNRTGRYIKVGSLVYINIAINLSSKGTATGDAKVSGLPFTQSSVGTNFPNLILRSVAGITFTNCLYATANDGSTEIQLMDDNGSGTQANLTNSDFTTTAEFNITGVYEAA